MVLRVRPLLTTGGRADRQRIGQCGNLSLQENRSRPPAGRPARGRSFVVRVGQGRGQSDGPSPTKSPRAPTATSTKQLCEADRRHPRPPPSPRLRHPPREAGAHPPESAGPHIRLCPPSSARARQVRRYANGDRRPLGLPRSRVDQCPQLLVLRACPRAIRDLLGDTGASDDRPVADDALHEARGGGRIQPTLPRRHGRSMGPQHRAPGDHIVDNPERGSRGPDSQRLQFGDDLIGNLRSLEPIVSCPRPT
jgi:hypothetical protein